MPTAPGASPTTATYRWQRFDSTGANLEADRIGKGSTYTPTGADLGKALKVMISFTDDDGYGEGPPTSAATPAIAAAPVPLVGNAGQGGDSNASYTADHGQAFTTGYNLTGYTVSGVTIISEDGDDDDIALQICGVNTSGHPTTSCTDLTAPASSAAGPQDFTVANGTTLTVAASTTSMVVFKSPGGQLVHVDATNSAGQDASSLPGWSIRDRFQWNNGGSWQDSSRSRAIRIAIRGNVNPPSATAPTAVDGTVTATEDTAYTFTAADFNFSATTGGDTLASVEILTLPALGALALDGTAVTADQSVTKDQLDASNLVYTPVANASGPGYASFLFRVSGSTASSTLPYPMTIDVTPVNDPATGTTTISGTARVGMVLTAVTGAVQDPDGPGSFSYQWIRVDADGTSNPTNIGENSNAYLLAEADLGKRVQVRADFTDGSGFAESLTSEASPSSGAVQPLDGHLVSNLTQSGDAECAVYQRSRAGLHHRRRQWRLPGNRRQHHLRGSGG